MDTDGPLKVILWGVSKRKGESRRESLNLLRESLCNPEQRGGGNTDGKGSSAEVSDGSEEHVIRQWRKGHPYY